MFSGWTPEESTSVATSLPLPYRSSRKEDVALSHLYEVRHWHSRAWISSWEAAETWRLVFGNFVVGAVTYSHVSEGPPNLWMTCFFLDRVQQNSDILLLIFLPKPDMGLNAWIHF